MAMCHAKAVSAAALALVGVSLLIGCIPVPVYRPTKGGPRPEERIGQLRSSKPLQLGRSTRVDVWTLLVAPQYTPDDRTEIYSYRLTTVSWLYPLCSFALPQEELRYLRLEYDDGDVLRRYKVFTTLEQAQANRK
jgi:hypothetical protein